VNIFKVIAAGELVCKKYGLHEVSSRRQCSGGVGIPSAQIPRPSRSYHVLRVVIVSFTKGSPLTMAVEFGRRAIPGHHRPSFQELEKFIKDKGDAPAAAAA
jgi:hypothetical protein